MQVDYDKVYHEVPGVVPFDGTVNAVLSGVIRAETNDLIRHKPNIKISRSSQFDTAVSTFLTVADDMGSLLDGNAGALKHAGTVSKWNDYLRGDANSTTYPYDRGLEVFQLLMNQRSVALDALRKDIHTYFCTWVLRLEKEIHTYRTETIPASGCSASERAALDGWFARGTQLSNQTMIDAAGQACATRW